MSYHMEFLRVEWIGKVVRVNILCVAPFPSIMERLTANIHVL